MMRPVQEPRTTTLRWRRCGRLLLPALVLVGALACGIPIPTTFPSLPVPIPKPPSHAEEEIENLVQWIVNDCLAASWLVDWKAEESRRPRVVVGRVENLSLAEANTALVVQRIERAIDHSGFGVNLAQDGCEPDDLKNYIDAVHSDAPAETIASLAAALEADHMLLGSVHELEKKLWRRKKKNVQRTFALEIEIIDLATGETVCIERDSVAWRE